MQSLCPPHPKYFCASIMNLAAMGQSGKTQELEDMSLISSSVTQFPICTTGAQSNANADAFWKPGCGIQNVKCYDGIVGHTVLFEVLPSPCQRCIWDSLSS